MPRRRTVPALMLVVALMALSSCGGEDETATAGTSPPTTGTPATAAGADASLPGTAWALRSYRGADGTAVPASGDGLADLAFGAGDQLTGSTGCNRVVGTYVVSGSSLTLRPGATTMMACLTASLQDQETALLALLPQVTGFTTTSSGDLELLDAGGAVALTYRPGTVGLEGTAWAATGVNNGRDAVEGTALTDALTATFGSEGAFEAFGGCNPISGTYATGGGTALTFLGLTAGSASCGGEVDELEARYLAALQATTTFEITGDVLTLRDDTGAAQVVYQRAGG